MGDGELMQCVPFLIGIVLFLLALIKLGLHKPVGQARQIDSDPGGQLEMLDEWDK